MTQTKKQQIVITGATGNTGQVVVEECKQRGLSFVAMVRSKANQEQMAALGIETVMGDFDDPPSLERALDGVEKAYLVCTPNERLIPRESAFIAAAKKAGVHHIVRCSAYMAGEDSETQILRAHGLIERELIESGLEYTILRPIGYMQTFTLFGWEMIQKASVISLPLGDGGMPLIDVRDVAQVAVKALTERGHEGKIYDLTGPESLNLLQVAEILTRVLDRRVTYIPGSEKQFEGFMRLLGVPEIAKEHVIKIMRMQSEHRIEKVHHTLQELGIQPITYEQFLHDLIAGRTGGGNSFQPPNTLLFKTLNAVMPLVMRLRVALGAH